MNRVILCCFCSLCIWFAYYILKGIYVRLENRPESGRESALVLMKHRIGKAVYVDYMYSVHLVHHGCNRQRHTGERHLRDKNFKVKIRTCVAYHRSPVGHLLFVVFTLLQKD